MPKRIAMNDKADLFCWRIQEEGLTVYLASSRKGAKWVGLSLTRESDIPTYFKFLFPQYHIVEDKIVSNFLIAAVKSALAGKAIPHDLPLDITCTPFQMMTWKAISKIPFGRTKTYGEVAKMINKSGGARAVGQAMNKNPLPLIFP